MDKFCALQQSGNVLSAMPHQSRLLLRGTGHATMHSYTTCHLEVARLAAQGVTYDASEAAGSAARCVNNTRAAIAQIFRISETADGRQQLRRALRLCDDLPPGCAEAVAYWVQVCVLYALASSKRAPCRRDAQWSVNVARATSSVGPSANL